MRNLGNWLQLSSQCGARFDLRFLGRLLRH
ncbi:MAG: hypothetical protein QOG48_766, partial [Verrucomicrobiota bacterium]